MVSQRQLRVITLSLLRSCLTVSPIAVNGNKKTVQIGATWSSSPIGFMTSWNLHWLHEFHLSLTFWRCCWRYSLVRFCFIFAKPRGQAWQNKQNSSRWQHHSYAKLSPLRISQYILLVIHLYFSVPAGVELQAQKELTSQKSLFSSSCYQIYE